MRRFKGVKITVAIIFIFVIFIVIIPTLLALDAFGEEIFGTDSENPRSRYENPWYYIVVCLVFVLGLCVSGPVVCLIINNVDSNVSPEVEPSIVTDVVVLPNYVQPHIQPDVQLDVQLKQYEPDI
jgi:uncharacterized membrane protein